MFGNYNKKQAANNFILIAKASLVTALNYGRDK